MVNGQPHNRPCFYTFLDEATGLYWLIPFSSQTAKFHDYYNKKIQKYGKCDTIVFGEVLGHEKAFLIQNICPVTSSYILNEYIDSVANIPVRVDGRLEQEDILEVKEERYPAHAVPVQARQLPEDLARVRRVRIVEGDIDDLFEGNGFEDDGARIEALQSCPGILVHHDQLIALAFCRDRNSPIGRDLLGFLQEQPYQVKAGGFDADAE